MEGPSADPVSEAPVLREDELAGDIDAFTGKRKPRLTSS